MTGSDDLVARLEAAIEEIEALVYGGKHDGSASLARAVTTIRSALASRDKEIERLTEELSKETLRLSFAYKCKAELNDEANFERNRAATATRERDEWRDATMESRKGCVQRSEVISSLHQHLETATRERDEARRYCSAAYHDLVGMFETIKDRQELFPRTTHDLIETSEFMKLAADGKANGTLYDDELSKEKARAETAERERDEAREERDKAESERAEEWRKRRDAEVDRDVMKAAIGAVREERDEAMDALRRLLEACQEEHGCFPRSRCSSEHSQADDDELAAALAAARAALHPEGAKDGQS